MLQGVKFGIGHTRGIAPRGASDGEGRAPKGREFVRAVYEAAGGSSAKPVDMRPLARRLGLDSRAVANLTMRLQGERLVRVVSMANGLLRLTPEGVRAAEGARSESSAPAAPTGAPGAEDASFADARAAPASPVVGRGVLRELEGMLDPLKADMDRLDLDGALDEEQRSELAADIRTIEAQLGSPRPKWQIVVAGLESVKDVVESAAGGAESERILRAIDAFLDGTGQTGRAARGAGRAAGEAVGGAQAGRAAQGARNGAGGLARPGSDLAVEDGLGARRSEEGLAAVRAREAAGVRVRKRVRGGTERATEQAHSAGWSVGEGASEAVVKVGKGAGAAVEDAGEGAD